MNEEEALNQVRATITAQIKKGLPGLNLLDVEAARIEGVHSVADEFLGMIAAIAPKDLTDEMAMLYGSYPATQHLPRKLTEVAAKLREAADQLSGSATRMAQQIEQTEAKAVRAWLDGERPDWTNPKKEDNT